MAANTITINDKEYDIDAMTDDQKYLAGQIDAHNRKIAGIHFDLDGVMMAKQGFVNALAASLKSQEDDDGENGNGSTQAD